MLRQFLTLATGEVAARGLQVLGIILLTRRVGVDAIGDFGMATVLAAYGLLPVLQGFDPMAVRAAARKEIDADTAAGQIVGLRLLFAAVTALVTVLFAWSHPGDEAAGLWLILSVTYFSTALAPRWFFLANQRSGILAAAGTVAQAVFLGGVLTVHDPAGLSRAAWAQVAGEALSAGYLWWAAGCPRPRVSLSFSRWLMRESWPVTLSLLMGTALYNFDMLALGAMGRRAQVGSYLASYRCLTIFGPLLAALQNALLPRLAVACGDLPEFRRSVRLFALTISAGLGGVALLLFLFANPVLRLLYGPEIGESAGLLQILAWALPIQGGRAVLRQALYALRGQKTDARTNLLGAVTNVGLDLALVPAFGAVGCAWSTLAAEAVLLAGSWLGVFGAKR